MSTPRSVLLPFGPPGVDRANFRRRTRTIKHPTSLDDSHTPEVSPRSSTSTQRNNAITILSFARAPFNLPPTNRTYHKVSLYEFRAYSDASGVRSVLQAFADRRINKDAAAAATSDRWRVWTPCYNFVPTLGIPYRTGWGLKRGQRVAQT